MRDAEEWAREWHVVNSAEGLSREAVAELITAARREGAEDMRAKTAMLARAFGMDAAETIGALPLPGDE